MKRSFSLFISFLALAGFLLAACNVPVPTATQENLGSDSAEVEFIGKIEAIKDNQWTINGQDVAVSAELTRETTFQVGDEVKVKATINKDGLVQAQSIQKSGDDSGNSNDNNGNDNNANDDNANDDNSNDGNSNDDNGNDDNSNDGNSNDDNSNDDNSNDGNSNDDNSNDDNSNDDNSNDDDDND